MGVAAIFAIFAATYFWFPKMFGRMMNETLGKIHFWLTFVWERTVFLCPCIFWVSPGMSGAIREIYRRLPHPADTGAPVHYGCDPRHRRGAVYFSGELHLEPIFKEQRARTSPWQATTLEWTVSSPPPFATFGGRRVVVNWGPEEYGFDAATGDYVVQSAPEEDVEY